MEAYFPGEIRQSGLQHNTTYNTTITRQPAVKTAYAIVLTHTVPHEKSNKPSASNPLPSRSRKQQVLVYPSHLQTAALTALNFSTYRDEVIPLDSSCCIIRKYRAHDIINRCVFSTCTILLF